MAGSEEYLDFIVKLSDLKTGEVEDINLRAEEGQVIKIGRATKSDVPISSPGISWVHAELRLQPKPEDEAEGRGQFRIAIRDVSSNGTGLQLPGKTLERLPKNEDTLVPEGAMVALPMRLKAAEDQRFLSLHLPTGATTDDDAAAPAAQAEAEAEESGAKEAEAEAEESGAKEVAVEAEGIVESGPVEIDSDSDVAVSAKPRSEEPKDDAEAIEGAEGASDSRRSNFASHLTDVVAAGADATLERMLAASTTTNGAPQEADAAVEQAEEPATKRARKELPMPPPKPMEPKPVVDTQALADGMGTGLPPARPPSGPPGVRPPPRGARPKAAAFSLRASASSDVPAVLRDKIQVGEDIIRAARDAEDRNQWGQAFDCYQKGLANFMEVLPQLGKDSPGGMALRKQINGYLVRAGELKEKLERSRMFGCRKLVRPKRPEAAA